MAAGGELVELRPRQAPLGGDQLGADALRHKAFGVSLLERLAEWIGARQDRRSHRDARHRFDARCDDDVVRAGDHALRGEMDGLLAASALPVDRRTRYRLGKSRGQQGVARDVDGLIAHLCHGAGDHVVDQHRVDARPLDQRAQTVGEKIRGVDAVQRTAGLALADRGAYRARR